MGLMDKAKKLAEQAQQKLDEAQTQFNPSGSARSQPDPSAPEASTVRYDEHGRPIPEPPPAEAAATPDPAAPTSDPAAPTPASSSAPAAPTHEQEPPPGNANATPDPFKPLQ